MMTQQGWPFEYETSFGMAHVKNGNGISDGEITEMPEMCYGRFKLASELSYLTKTFLCFRRIGSDGDTGIAVVSRVAGSGTRT
jgi:hypothetical protein